MKMTRFILMIAVTALLFSACKKQSKTTLDYIPGDAQMVATINLDQLGEKMNINELKNSKTLALAKIFLTMSGIPDIIEDRSLSGIDFNTPVYMFGSGTMDNMKINILVNLEDKEKLKSIIQKIDDKSAFETKQGIDFMDSKAMSMAMNDQIAIISMANPVFGENKSSGKSAFELFTMENENSLAQTDLAADILEGSKNDITFHANNEQSYKMIQASLPGMDLDFLKSSKGSWSLNFEEGKIVAKNKMIPGTGEYASLMRSFATNKFNEDLLLGIDAETVPALFSFSMNMKETEAMLDSMGIIESLFDRLKTFDHGAFEHAIEIFEDVMKGLSGDAVLALTGMGTTEYVMNDETMEKQIPLFYASIGVTDRSILQKYLDMPQAAELLSDHGDYYQINDSEMPLYLIIGENAATITNSDDTRDYMLSGPSELKLDPELLKKIQENPVYGIADFNTLDVMLNVFMDEASTTADIEIPDYMGNTIETLVSLFDKCEMTSTVLEDGTHESLIIMEMKSKEGNSLETLTKMIIEMAGPGAL